MRCGLLSVLALTPFALAYPEITSPAAGASLPAGAITVKWAESGATPLITQLSSYTMNLMVGGNEPGEAQSLVAIGTAGALFSAGNQAVGTITPTLAQSLTNGFFIQMVATAKDGGTITVFSNRFTLTGMTGTTSRTIVQQVQALAGTTTGPTNIDAVTPDTETTAKGGAAKVPTPAAPPAVAPAGAFNVPYNLQTGLTRYAPMQPIPPTKITANNPSPLFPTSPFDIAQTKLPPPTVLTTMTQPQTFSVQSVQNTIAPAPFPSQDNKAKFLKRWRD